MATSPKIRAWDRLALNTVDVFLKRTIKRGQLRCGAGSACADVV